MSTLHERLLTRITEDSDGCEDTSAQTIVDALRAVVKRHRPRPCTSIRCATPGHQLCAACGSAYEYPAGCLDTVAIAAALGVEVDDG